MNIHHAVGYKEQNSNDKPNIRVMVKEIMTCPLDLGAAPAARWSQERFYRTPTPGPCSVSSTSKPLGAGSSLDIFKRPPRDLRSSALTPQVLWGLGAGGVQCSSEVDVHMSCLKTLLKCNL